jgi:CHAT domain-containing protein/Flp pilus assembly protein TadD
MKKVFSSFLALSIGLTGLSSIIVSQPSKAQIQNSPDSKLLDELVAQAIAQTKQGQPRNAIATLQKVIELARKLKNPQVEAYALLGIGTNYDTLGEPQSALNSYNNAIALFQAAKDPDGEAVVLSNLSAVYLSTGQPQQALSVLQQSLVLRRQVKGRPGEAVTLNNLGAVYKELGQFQQALAAYNQALPLLRKAKDRPRESTALNNIGETYLAIGQPQQALKFFQQALQIDRTLSDRPQDATILNNLGVVYRELGQSNRAISYVKQALQIHQKTDNRLGAASSLNNLGAISDDIGQSQSALEYYNSALAIYKQVGDFSGEANTINNLGATYASLGKLQQALTYYKSALPLRRTVGDKAGEAATLTNIGAVYRDLKQPIEAIASYEQSVTITLQLRSGLEKVNRRQFLDSNSGSAIALTDLLIEQKQPERAYQWVNLTTTADLADYSRLIDAKVANPQAQRAIERWNQSNRQLENLRQQLQKKFSPQLSGQINTLQTQINQQAENITRQFPEVAELFETKLTDIARLRANIPSGTVVIQPVLLTNTTDVQNTIALFVLTSGKLTVTQKKIDPKAFDELVTQYRQQLTDGRFNKYRATSAKLYEILIRPIESQIPSTTKQLSIVATGKLRYIPFETLIDTKTGKYLIEKYPINNLTRLTTRSLQKPLDKNKAVVLAIGNPFPNDRRNLAGAAEEVKDIAAILPGSIAETGKQATLHNFELQAPRFSILHLATHGCFNPQGCPQLKLEANTLLFSDRNLNIADAALLGLKNTDLVVLSACQTAVQANSNGEEFAGIAYLFERAGANSVIASLWLAKDEETKQLMIEFYQNLKQGKTKGEALQSAKLSLIDKHPLYWSPFILIGDAR